MKKLILVALLACLASPANAVDAKGNYFARSLGTQPCEFWTTERKKEPSGLAATGILTWIYGFLTAANYLTPNTYDVAFGVENSTIRQWVDKYCAQNPDEKISTAAVALLSVLRDR